MVANDDKPFLNTKRYIPLLDLWNWMYNNFCETLKNEGLLFGQCVMFAKKSRRKSQSQRKKKRYHEARRLFLCQKRFHPHHQMIRDGTSCTLMFILITKKMDLTWQPLSSHYKAPMFRFETKKDSKTWHVIVTTLLSWLDSKRASASFQQCFRWWGKIMYVTMVKNST